MNLVTSHNVFNHACHYWKIKYPVSNLTSFIERHNYFPSFKRKEGLWRHRNVNFRSWKNLKNLATFSSPMIFFIFPPPSLWRCIPISSGWRWKSGLNYVFFRILTKNKTSKKVGDPFLVSREVFLYFFQLYALLLLFLLSLSSFSTFKYHVSCTDGKISVWINLLFYLFFHRRWGQLNKY